MSDKWIDEKDAIIFEKGKDPGEGSLRIVGDLQKMITIEGKHSVSFHEVFEIVFGKGTSTFIEQYSKETKKGEDTFVEEQYRIAGLTKEGRPLIVVMTPRDNGHAKRIITSWQISKDSEEFKKLLKDCPHLAAKLPKE